MSDHGGPRAAIIGAGLMGRWHADAVRKAGGRVTVIVDPNDAARETLGRRYPKARLAPELDPTFVARHANAAHVCTPLSTHAAVVRGVVEAGLHALVEKPFAESADSTVRLLSVAEARGVIVCPVHQFVFQDGVQRIFEWMPGLGRVCQLEFSTRSAGAANDDQASRDELVAEILPHPLSLVAALLDAPLGAQQWQIVYPSAGELRAVTTIGGVVVAMAISAHGRPTENVLRVVGTAGSATADLFHGFAVRQPGLVSRQAKMAQPFVAAGLTLASASLNLARRALLREPAYPGLRELVRRFYSATRGERPVPFSPASIADIACARDRIIGELRAVAPT